MKVNDDRPLHIRAQDERDRRGWSQKEAADAAGMSLRAYQEFEAGRSSPQSKNLRGILRAFELDGSEPPPEPRENGPAWPKDIRAFQNMIGAYLLTMSEPEREAWIFAETRRIFESARSPDAS